MSDRSDEDLTTLVTDLVTTLRDLETAVEPRTPGGRRRPPTPGELLRFTSDVTIPAAILVLRTNIEALKLLRRAIRLAEGRPSAGESPAADVRKRAANLSDVTLARLDDALAEIQRAVEGTPEDEDARELLTEARELRSELRERVQATEDRRSDTDDAARDVAVDVDAELESIKDDVARREDGGGRADGEQSGADDGS